MSTATSGHPVRGKRATVLAALVVLAVLVVVGAIVVLAGADRRDPYAPAPAAAFSAGGVDVRLQWDAGTDGPGRRTLVATFTPQQPGFHLYDVDLPPGGVDGLGTATRVAPRDGLSATGRPQANQTVVRLRVEGLAQAVPVYPDGPVTLRLPVQVGSPPATVLVSYGACSATQCLVPVIDREVPLTPPPAS